MKAIAKETAPRKLPTQPRARVTVECILQAAESIISKQGYDYATNNHIAEVAGVSIGTIYQYFPRKEARLAALIEDVVIKSSAPVRQQLLACMHEPLAQCNPGIMRLLLLTRKKNATIFKHLHREGPDVDASRVSLTPETFLYPTVRSFYLHHRDEIKIENLDMAMAVVEYMVVGGINSYLEDPAPALTDDEFADQLANAVTKYLTT